MDVRAKLDAFIEQHGIKHWSFAARNDVEFVEEVTRLTLDYPDLSFAARVYCAAFAFDPRCEHDKLKKFISIPKGWGFCGKSGECPCASASVSKKCRENIDHKARLKKTASTLQARYGNPNPGQSPAAKAAHRAFYTDSEKVGEAVAKGKATVAANDSYAPRRQQAQLNKTERTRRRHQELTTYSGDIPDGMISCRLCNRPFRMITPAHCRLHGITIKEYLAKFPGARLCVDEIAEARRAYGHSDLHKEKMDKAKHDFHSPEAREILFSKENFLALLAITSVAGIAKHIGIDPETVRRYAHEYGHEFSTTTSSFEREIAAFLRDHGLNFTERNRSVISPRELDFYFPDQRLAIEFNGLYWHSDRIVANDYHQDKWRRCEAAGVRLLMINEDEWLNRADILKKKVLNLCGRSERGVGARKLTVNEIPSVAAAKFCDEHHIQGAPGSCSAAFGAYHGDALVGVLTFSRQRGTQTLELSRFCSDGKTYAGMFSKLLKVARSEIREEIVTFADLRYSDGGLYERCGFTREKVIRPDYRYVKNGMTFHKSLFTKTRIAKKFGIDMSDKTEREVMRELGYSRIYDCGKIRYRLARARD